MRVELLNTVHGSTVQIIAETANEHYALNMMLTDRDTPHPLVEFYTHDEGLNDTRRLVQVDEV